MKPLSSKEIRIDVCPKCDLSIPYGEIFIKRDVAEAVKRFKEAEIDTTDLDIEQWKLDIINNKHDEILDKIFGSFE